MRWILLSFLLLLALPVQADALYDATEQALRGRGLDGPLVVEITSLPATGLGETVEVTITSLEPASGRFSGVAFSLVDGGAREARISGRVDRMVQVPVPNRAIAPGEKIAPNDLDWLDLASSRVAAHTVTDATAIVGYAAKRGLRAGHPVSMRQIALPVVVRKGSLVTMSLAGPGLLLTATGRALENGSDGETISLINIQSKRTVQATVIGPDQVRIDDTGLVAMR